MRKGRLIFILFQRVVQKIFTCKALLFKNSVTYVKYVTEFLKSSNAADEAFSGNFVLFGERLFYIGNDVVGVFDPDRESD